MCITGGVVKITVLVRLHVVNGGENLSEISLLDLFSANQLSGQGISTWRNRI